MTPSIRKAYIELDLAAGEIDGHLSEQERSAAVFSLRLSKWNLRNATMSRELRKKVLTICPLLSEARDTVAHTQPTLKE